MYGINIMSLMIFGAMNVMAVRMCKLNEIKRIRIIKMLCAALLLLNTVRDVVRMIITQKIVFHVEFSAVSYFVVPIIVLLGWKKMTGWAAYSGLMAGFFYYAAMIVAGGQLYGSHPPYTIYISMFCHGTLFVCGFVTTVTQKCAAGDPYRLMVGIGLVGLNAFLLRPFVNPAERLFIYILMDGAFSKSLLPQVADAKIMPVYYVLLAGFVVLSIIGFVKVNRRLTRKYMVDGNTAGIKAADEMKSRIALADMNVG